MKSKNITKRLEDTAPAPISAREKQDLWSRIDADINHMPVVSPVSVFSFSQILTKQTTTALVVILFVVGVGGTAYASDNARPGDLLFPLDTRLENIRLSLAPENKKGALRVQFAEERIHELMNIVSETTALHNTPNTVPELSAEDRARLQSAVETTRHYLEDLHTNTPEAFELSDTLEKNIRTLPEETWMLLDDMNDDTAEDTDDDVDEIEIEFEDDKDETDIDEETGDNEREEDESHEEDSEEEEETEEETDDSNEDTDAGEEELDKTEPDNSTDEDEENDKEEFDETEEVESESEEDEKEETEESEESDENQDDSETEEASEEDETPTEESEETEAEEPEEEESEDDEAGEEEPEAPPEPNEEESE